MNRFIRHIIAIAALILCGSAAVYADDSSLPGQTVAVERPAHQIRPGSHCVEIVITDDSTHDVVIYALTGQVVKQLNLNSGSTVVDLNPGYYIVRIDGLSKRVVVK